MTRRPIYHPDFYRDVTAGFDWYALRDMALAADFTQKIGAAVADMLQDPERRSPVDYGIRYWPVAKFPHLVLYDLTTTNILIVGVKHPSQDISQWLERRG